MRELTCAVALMALVLCCSCEKQAERSRNPASGPGIAGTTGTYALEISPKTASRNSTVNLIPTGFTASDAKIEWLVNGAPAESASPTQFIPAEARKGDTLQARAFVHGREVLSDKIEIANAPPEITGMEFIDQSMKPGGALGVAVTGRDADGDSVTFLYEWTINGAPAGIEKRIGRPVKRGDVVVVKATPYDGESYGRSVELKSEIQNLPPVIQEHGEFQFDGARYTYQVKASDPDGDPLTYAIESTAEGMTIDKSSGLITWNVPAEFKGRKNVSVIVTDGHGGTARYVLNITIQ